MELLRELNLDWSPPKRVETSQGDRCLRSAAPTEEFWEVWRSDKETLKASGVQVSKPNGAWVVNLWSDIPEEIVTREAAQLEASKLATCDYYPPCPPGKSFYPYQRAGVYYALNCHSPRGFLFGDEAGLGKTCQTIGYINATSCRKILVVCPATMKLTWCRELKGWLTRDLSFEAVKNGKSKFPTTDIVVINYELLHKFPEILDTSWDLVVGDEAHYLKSGRAKRTKTFKKIKTKKYGLLTYTPVLNRPSELWTICQLLDPDGLGNYYFKYVRRYCDAKQTRFGLDVSGASNLGELYEKLRSRFMVRRLKKDVFSELPPLTYQVIEVDVPNIQKLLKDELGTYNAQEAARIAINEQRELLDEKKYKQFMEALKSRYRASVQELADLRVAVAHEKVPSVVELVKDAKEAKQPILVFAYHREIVDRLSREFPEAGVILGGDSQKHRQDVIDGFQEGRFDICILSIQACYAGITLSRAERVLFAELSFVPGIMAQAAQRAHRVDNLHPVLVQYLVLSNSLDAHIVGRLLEKQDIIDSALDNAV